MAGFAQQDGAGTFVDWGVLHVSVTNLAVVAAMLVLFALALVLPFPGHGHPPVATPPAPVDPSPAAPERDVR